MDEVITTISEPPISSQLMGVGVLVIGLLIAGLVWSYAQMRKQERRCERHRLAMQAKHEEEVREFYSTWRANNRWQPREVDFSKRGE